MDRQVWPFRFSSFTSRCKVNQKKGVFGKCPAARPSVPPCCFCCFFFPVRLGCPTNTGQPPKRGFPFFHPESLERKGELGCGAPVFGVVELSFIGLCRPSERWHMGFPAQMGVSWAIPFSWLKFLAAILQSQQGDPMFRNTEIDFWLWA